MAKNPASEYQACIALEKLLDSLRVPGPDLNEVYESFLALVPSIREMTLREGREVDFPIKAIARLGEIAESYEFKKSQRYYL